MKKKLNKKGFTLVELIVVIAILAILAAILVPTMTGIIADAQATACEANRKTVETTLTVAKQWNMSHGASDQRALSDYISELPTCPAGGAYKVGTADLALTLAPTASTNITVTCTIHNATPTASAD